MTDAFKRAVRARAAQTGEKYTQARRALLAERDAAAAPRPPRRPPRILSGGPVIGEIRVHDGRTAELDNALATFGEPRDLLLAFHGEDLLLKAGLNPAQLATRGGQTEPSTICLTNCLLGNARSQWLVLDGPNCGYVGAGPRDTLALVEHLGVNASAIADRVTRDRYLRIDVPTGEIVDHSRNPVSRVGLNGRPVADGVTVVRLFSHPYRAREDCIDPAPGNDYQEFLKHRSSGQATLRTWRDHVLKAPDCPPWAAGPTRARCYLTYEAVHTSGLVDPSPFGSMPSVVIEQGQLQLWCDAGTSLDRRELLSEDTQRALNLLGLPIPRENVALRLLRHARGRNAPVYIDVDEDGAGLAHDPAELAKRIQATRKRAVSASTAHAGDR